MVTEEEGEGFEPTQTMQKSWESSYMIHLRPRRMSIILYDAMKVCIIGFFTPFLLQFFMFFVSTVNTQEKDGNFRASNTVQCRHFFMCREIRFLLS
jgi:hypothetical protein